jgi:hypothetical protein
MNYKTNKILNLVIALFLTATTSNAQVYVNTAASGMNNGTSWANAYNSLQDALSNSTSGSDIWIAQGTYSPGAATTDHFDLSTPGLKLYGGFTGTETILSQRDFTTNKTRLSGDANGDDVTGDFSTNRSDNNLHVMIIDDTITNSAILDGLIIEHGQTEGASGSGNDRRGGGILCFGSPIIRNCELTQNYGYYGSSLYPRGNAAASNILVADCKFIENEGRSGGAVYLVAGGTFNNCVFDNNFAIYGGSVYSGGNPTTFNHCEFINSVGSDTRGAGIYGSTAITLNNCLIENNSGIWGCGIYATDVTILDSCEIKSNTATNNGGGLLMAFGAVTTITNTSFEGNVADNGAALYTQNDSTLLIIDNSTFFGNTTTGGNGGVFYSLAGPLATFTNSEFDLNTGNYGGAMAFNSNDSKLVQDRLTVTNCVFKNNIADVQGGAINLSNVDSVFLTNCLIVDNQANGIGTGGGLAINSSDTLGVYTEIMNCTFANNSGILASNIATWQDDATAGNAQVVMQNTILYDQASTNYAIEAGTPTLTSNGGNLSGDISMVVLLTESTDVNDQNPFFEDDSNGDYRLFPTSICIDAGVGTNAPITDINGDSRVGTPDKGAIEYPYLSNTKAIADLENGFEIFPNPVRESLTFQLENEWKGDIQFTIINNIGQVMRNWTITKNQTMMHEQVDINDLTVGNYILIARFKDSQVQEVIIKM